MYTMLSTKIKRHTCPMQSSFANQHDAPSFWFCLQVTEVITRITFPSVLQEQINQRSLLFFPLWAKFILHLYYATKLTHRFIGQGRSCSYLLLTKSFSFINCQFYKQDCSRLVEKELRKALGASTRWNATR